jgi:hypothetical protein
MTVHFFMHTKSKRAEALTLVDSGATENFMNVTVEMMSPRLRATEEC